MIDTARLLAETCVRNVEWLDEVGSTNDRALQLSIDPLIETPYLVGADRQWAGRGRGSNQWWGADGSLMFSIVVGMSALNLTPADWPHFSLVTGLAIAETLSKTLPGANVGLKWPNDVWLEGRKVSGILIEQCERQSDRLIVGVGLNVNNSFATAPAELKGIATSMVDAAGGTEFSRTDVLITFLTCWSELTEQLARNKLSLVERWSRLCVLTGHPVTLTNGNQETMGVCAGIDADGALLLRTAFNLERHYAGTVRRLD
ncbi:MULTISPECIES: biotin--[acetyl-CoA-carboxylase] ligase [unclassified Schlesneria]|uniref:biotin--[acetyl-CoA-carboxylase] ligase n=1 Tax=unclassified Schlesneria TaxID=2762017 RepID=UPI002EF9ABA2